MENASKALIIAGAILISILLISVGIILIRTGSDNVGAGVSEMSSEKIQGFNSKFTIYEGEQKGNKLKDLANAVRAMNASDAEHQVVLRIQNATNAAGNNVTTLAGLTSSKTYNVTLTYSQTGTETEPSGGTVIVNPVNWSTEPGYVMDIKISN